MKKEVDKAFARADLDGDGGIDFSEWQISCVNKEQILKKDRLAEAFKHFDKDGDGKISAKEIKKVLGAGGKKFGNENIWKQIISEADEDGDGYITFVEFQKMMNQFMRASEFIDRISVQNMKMKPIVKKNIEDSSLESKTPKFTEVEDD